jgi:DNA-binding SARP family transcriptional activator
MDDLEYRILGPVEVRRGGRTVAVTGSTTLVLLAGLLVSANCVIPVDRLVELLWGARLPVHPRAALHNGVARLRRLLGEDAIETLTWGYRLNTSSDRLDLLRFNQLCELAAQTATNGRNHEALTALDAAVALWQEPPLGNIDSAVLRREAVPRLTERYLDVVEERAELCLRLGRHTGLAEELQEILRRHPFRERIVGQLMVALVRSRRQAAALATYDTLRCALNEELGIDPVQELQDLRLQVLRADPALQIPGDPTQPSR